MRIKGVLIFVVAAGLGCGSFTAAGHPSSGIVVDSQGQVFFTDLSRGLLKIDAQGKVTSVARAISANKKRGGPGSPRFAVTEMLFGRADGGPPWQRRSVALPCTSRVARSLRPSPRSS